MAGEESHGHLAVKWLSIGHVSHMCRKGVAYGVVCGQCWCYVAEGLRKRERDDDSRFVLNTELHAY